MRPCQRLGQQRSAGRRGGAHHRSSDLAEARDSTHPELGRHVSLGIVLTCDKGGNGRLERERQRRQRDRAGRRVTRDDNQRDGRNNRSDRGVGEVRGEIDPATGLPDRRVGRPEVGFVAAGEPVR